MKIFSFIFSFYLLFLAVEPGLKAMTLNEAQEISCCSDTSCEPIEKEQPAKQLEKKEGDDNSACNPFQICKACIAFTGAFALQTVTPIILFATLQSGNKDKVPPQITLDFWQPPKIA